MTAASECFACRHNQATELPVREAVYRSPYWRVAHAFDSSLAGWLVLLPTEHVLSLAELEPEAAAELGPLLRDLTIALTDVVGAAKTYVMLFAEAEGFSHLHVHLVPRRPDQPEGLRGPRIFAALGAGLDERVGTAEMDRIGAELQARLHQLRPPPVEPTDVVRRLRAAGCVFAEDEAALLVGAATTPKQLTDLVQRRVAGTPLEQILGWADFGGLRIAVEPGVFVPRRRTEFLVRHAATVARPGAVVVDLCCGSGALGAALSATVDAIELYAADLAPASVHCARRNLPDAQVYEGDLFDPLPEALRGQVDVLLANVPYVPTDAIASMPPEARDHEPQAALDGGADGLDVLRRVAAAAPEWLAPGGSVLVETSEAQAPQAVEAFRAAGLIARVVADDQLGATVVIATRPTTRA